MSKQPNRGKRDRSVQFWCDELEFEFILKESKKAGISRGNFCRQVVLGQLPQPGERGRISRKEFKDLHREFAALGNNVNQIAKKFNTTEQPPEIDVLDHIKIEIDRLSNRLLEEL